MVDNDYHAGVMTHYMLREFHSQRKQKEEAAMEAENHVAMEYQNFDTEILKYPVFFNPACGYQSAAELLETGSAPEHRQRWRFFYQPDPDHVAFSRYKQQLDKEFVRLQRRLRTLTSPRLVVFSATFITIILLIMRGHFLLAILPILANAGYWYFSGQASQKVKQTLLRHVEKSHDFDNLIKQMEDELLELPAESEPIELQNHYRQAVEHLLRDTLLQLLHSYETGDLANTLRTNRWEGFITESWGYLQTPLQAQQNSAINHTLLDPGNKNLTALREDQHGRKGHVIYRVQYLHLWILTPNGLLMGYGYYDRVADHFLYEQHEYYPYSELNHIHDAEQVLPESSSIRDILTEKTYHDYFRHPLHRMTLTTTTGKSFECALPPANKRLLRQTFWLDHYGLDADMKRLNRSLHEKIYGTRPAVLMKP